MSQPNWDEPLPKSKPDPNSSAQQTADAGQEEACSLPLWLRLNPKWQQELADFSASKGIDVLRLLQLHGRRWFLDFYRYRLYGIIWPRRETFFEDQPYAEEGWATEQGVCLGSSIQPPRTRLTPAMTYCIVFWRSDRNLDW